MDHTLVNDSFYKLIPGRASGYYQDEGAWFNAPLTDSVIGSTNVYSTVQDLARWDRNFYGGQVGGPTVVESIHQAGRLSDGTVLDYAFGLMVGPTHRHRGWQIVEHGGSQGGYSSWMVRFPELQLSVVVLFNLFMWEMREYALQVADLFLEDHPSAAGVDERAEPSQTASPIELSTEHMASLSGTYFHAGRAVIREITVAGDRLQFQGLDLLPLSKTLFCFKVEPETLVEFNLSTQGRAVAMKTITASGEYGYERVETVQPLPGQLREYAGRYYSPELDVYWTLVAGDGHLVAKRHKYVDSKLSPVFVDAFSDDWQPIMGYPATYLAVFQRDERNAISGLRVSGTRVRNLKFEKLDP
jgi:hypothetical protein